MVVLCPVCLTTNIRDQFDLEYHALHAHGRQAFLVALKSKKDVSSILSQVNHDIYKLQARFQDQRMAVATDIPELTRVHAEEYQTSTTRRFAEPSISCGDNRVVLDINVNFRNNDEGGRVNEATFLRHHPEVGSPFKAITNNQDCNVNKPSDGTSRCISPLYTKSHNVEIPAGTYWKNDQTLGSSLCGGARKKQGNDIKTRKLVSDAKPFYQGVVKEEIPNENPKSISELHCFNTSPQFMVIQHRGEEELEQKINTEGESSQEWTDTVAEKLGNSLLTYMDKKTTSMLKQRKDTMSNATSDQPKPMTHFDIVSNKKILKDLGRHDFIEEQAATPHSRYQGQEGITKESPSILRQLASKNEVMDNTDNTKDSKRPDTQAKEISTCNILKANDRKKLTIPAEFQEKYLKQKNKLSQTKSRLYTLMDKFRELAVERQQFDDTLQQYVQSTERMQERLRDVSDKMQRNWKENNDFRVKVQSTLLSFQKRIGREINEIHNKQGRMCEEMRQMHQTEIVYLQKQQEKEINVCNDEISALRHQILAQKQQSLEMVVDSRKQVNDMPLDVTETFSIRSSSQESLMMKQNGDCTCSKQVKRSKTSAISRMLFGCFSGNSKGSRYNNTQCIYAAKYHKAIIEVQKSNDRCYTLDCELLEVTRRQNELTVREEQLTFELESCRQKCQLKDEEIVEMKRHMERLVLLSNQNTDRLRESSVTSESFLYESLQEPFDRFINDLHDKMNKMFTDSLPDNGILKQQENMLCDLFSDLKSEMYSLKGKLREKGIRLSDTIEKCVAELSNDRSAGSNDECRYLRKILAKIEAKNLTLKELVETGTINLERIHHLMREKELNEIGYGQLNQNTDHFNITPAQKQLCRVDRSTQTSKSEQSAYKKLFEVPDPKTRRTSDGEDDFHGQEYLKRSQSLSSIDQDQQNEDKKKTIPSVDMDYVGVLKKRLDNVSEELNAAVSKLQGNKCSLEENRVVIEELQYKNNQLKQFSKEKDSMNIELRKKLELKRNIVEKLMHDLKLIKEQKCKLENDNNQQKLQTQFIQTSFDKYKEQITELESKRTIKENMKNFREIGVLTDENEQQFKKKCGMLQKVVEKKERKIVDYCNKVKHLQEVEASYESKLHEAENSNDEKTQEVRELFQRIDLLKNKVKELEKVQSVSEIRCKEFEKDVANKKDQISELTAANTDLERRLEQLEEDQLKTNEVQLHKEYQRRQDETEYLCLKKSYDKLKEEKAYLQQQFDSSQDQISDSSNKLNLIQQQNLLIQNDKDKQIQSLKESLRNSEEEILQLKYCNERVDTIATKTYREFGTETDLSMAEILKGNVNQLSQAERKDTEIASYENEISSLRDQLKSLKIELEKVQQSYKDQTLETKKLQETNDSQYQKMRELAKYCNESTVTCSNLEKDVANKNTKIIELTQKISELDQQVRLSEKSNEDSNDIEKLRSTIDEQHIKMKEMAQFCNESEITIGNFAEEVSAKDNEILQLTKRNNDLEGEIEILKTKVTEIEISEKEKEAVNVEGNKEVMENSSELLQDLENKNIKVIKELENLGIENKKLKEHLEKNTAEKERVEEILQNIKEKNLQFEKELDVFKDKNDKLLKDYGLTEEKNKSLLQEKQSLEIRCAKLIAENRKPADLTKKNKDDGELISRLEVQVAGLVKERKQLLAQVDEVVCENEMLKEHIKNTSQEKRCFDTEEDVGNLAEEESIPLRRTDDDFDADSPNTRDRYYLSAEEDGYSSSVIDEMGPKPSFPIIDLQAADYQHENEPDTTLCSEHANLPQKHSLPQKPVLQPIASNHAIKNSESNGCATAHIVTSADFVSNAGDNKLLKGSMQINNGLSPLPSLTPVQTDADAVREDKELPNKVSSLAENEMPLDSPAKEQMDIPAIPAGRGFSPFQPLLPINPIKSADQGNSEVGHQAKPRGLNNKELQNVTGVGLSQSEPTVGRDLALLQQSTPIQSPLELNQQMKELGCTDKAESFAALVKPNPILQRSSGLPLSIGLTPIAKSQPPSLPTPKTKFQLRPLEPLEQLKVSDKSKKDKEKKKKKKKAKKEMIVQENTGKRIPEVVNNEHHQMAMSPVRNMRPGSSLYTPAAILQLSSQRQYEQTPNIYYDERDQYYNNANGYYDQNGGHYYEEDEYYQRDHGYYPTEHAYYQEQDVRGNAYYHRNDGVYYVDDTIIDL